MADAVLSNESVVKEQKNRTIEDQQILIENQNLVKNASYIQSTVLQNQGDALKIRLKTDAGYRSSWA
ncbi:MAG: hypothetical protein R2827_10250 [Bdellovibrionales bacterium]